MTAIGVCHAAPGSEQWRAQRALGVGGSEISTLLQLNPYATVLDLWLAKTGQAEPFAGNYATRRGQHMERFLLDTYAAEHPGTVIETAPADIPSIVAHKDVPVARVSLDGLAHSRAETAVIEAKTGNARQAAKWADGGMPDAYKAQAAYQLAVTGLDHCVVVADIVHEDSKAVEAQLQRADDPEFIFRAVWTMDRAKASGLVGKGGSWQSYPLAMLKARAITEVCRDACPEVLAGVAYTSEELQPPPTVSVAHLVPDKAPSEVVDTATGEVSVIEDPVEAELVEMASDDA